MSSNNRLLAKALAGVGLAIAACAVNAQVVSIGSGVPPTETFDIMAGTQGDQGSTLPTGWSFLEMGNGANTTYLIDNGSSQSGNTFSYGTIAASDRAFGLLASGSVVGNIGALLQNDTGASLTEIKIEYTGEQWRQGTPAGADKLDFQYCTTTCALGDLGTAANWTNFDALDLTAPVSTGTEGSILDGNLPANQVSKSATITGLSLAASGQMMIRWLDFNDGGVDDALAIDDVRIGLAVDIPPVVAQTSPAPAATGVVVTSNLVVTFSEAVTTDPGAFTLNCPSNASYPITVTGNGNTRTIDPDVDFAFGETCTATVVASNVSDVDGVVQAMENDYIWTFTTVADTVPTLVSTQPADNATGVLVNASVVINFSEPVNPTAPWISLICDGNPVTGTITGSNADATWTLDPTLNFNNGDVCNVVITGSQIVDLDGAPDALVGSPSFSFTVAPDIAPTITSTYPVNLDVNVPAASNLTVVFSEPVTAQAGAFVISCVGSGVHSFVLTNNAQTSYTLNPDADFTAGEECDFDITANLVTDIDGVANPLAQDRHVDFTIGAGIAGYYERVDTSSCRALRATLHGVIDDHSAVAYSDNGNTWTEGDPTTYDVWEVLNLADEDPGAAGGVGAGGKILDIYRNESYDKIAGGTGLYNREHVWPNSQGFNDLTDLDGFPNSPYTDTHMLMASNTAYNARRGSRLFGACPPPPGGDCTIDQTIANPSNGAGGGSTTYSSPPLHNWYSATDGPNGTYEVWSGRRGDLARAMLYMDVRYEGGRNSRNFQREPELILTDNRSLVINTSSYAAPAYSGLLTPILAWHNADLPTPTDVLRENVVENVQGNRNPFIDHPEWADLLFAAPTCTGPAVVAVDDDFDAVQNTVLNRNSANDIGVLNDDRAFAGGALTVVTTPISPPAHGAVVLSSNGQFVYTPATDFCGEDSFVYQSGNGTLSDTAIAHIHVACTTNSDPTAVGNIANVSTTVGATLSITTASAFNDANGDTLVYSVTSVPALPASLSINASTGVIGGTPVLADVGVYAVTVRATEAAPLTGFATQQFNLTINDGAVLIFSNGFE